MKASYQMFWIYSGRSARTLRYSELCSFGAYSLVFQIHHSLEGSSGHLGGMPRMGHATSDFKSAGRTPGAHAAALHIIGHPPRLA